MRAAQDTFGQLRAQELARDPLEPVGQQASETSAVDLSIVVPVFNEAPNLSPLYRELREALARLDGRVEIIFVDDASEDGGVVIIRDIAARDPRVRLLAFSTHAGLSAAFAAGIGAARAEIVVTIDADLQNDPRDIPFLLAHLDGADLVQGCRRRRHDSRLKRLSSWGFNTVRNLVLGHHVRDGACSLRAMRRCRMAELGLFDGFHRFLPSLFLMRGWRVVEVPVNHRPRRHGVSKFGIRNRLWVTLGDLLALRWMATHRLVYRAQEESVGVDAPPPAERSPARPALRPARRLIVLWAIVASVVALWGVLAAPLGGAGSASPAGVFTVLPARPLSPILTLWIRWEAPRGAVGWVALEPGRSWPGTGEMYWRRRVHPGWNQLVWDDFSGFPADRPVSLRVLEGQGRWTVAPAITSTRYTAAHLSPLRGLLAALLLWAGTAIVLLRRGFRTSGLPVPRVWHWVLIALAAVALGLRLHTLTSQSFWFDEVLTAIGAQSFAWVLYSPQVFGHPPLQYLVAWAAGGAHATEAGMRAPFVLAGVAGVLAVGALGRRALGASTGLVAAGLLAISPFDVELSQLARPYALLVLAVALSWLMLLRALEGGTAADWVSFSATATLACYTHYLAGLVLLAQAIVATTWVARRRGENGGRALVSFAAIALLLSPWAGILGSFAERQAGGGQVTAAALRQLIVGALVPQFLGSGLAAALTVGLFVLGLWRAGHRSEFTLAVLLVLALPFVALWATNPSHAIAGRHFAFALPMLILAVAHGLVSAGRVTGHALAGAVGARHAWIHRAGTTCAALVLILAGNLPAAADLGEYYRWRQGSDWRTVAAVLDRSVAPGDEVVATLGAVYPLRYYWREDVAQVDGPLLRERYRPDYPGRRLWIITLDGWDWKPDLRGWLAAHAIEVGEVPPSWSLPGVHIHRAQGGLAADWHRGVHDTGTKHATASSALPEFDPIGF